MFYWLDSHFLIYYKLPMDQFLNGAQQVQSLQIV